VSLGSQLGRFWRRQGRYLGRVGLASWSLAAASPAFPGLPFWLALDCWANAICGGNPTEWLSSRAAKARARWLKNADTPADRRAYLWGCVLCGLLEAIWPDHCTRSLQADKAK
jgi:hypothetical protein